MNDGRQTHPPAWRIALMESEDRVVRRWWRRATAVRERECDPKWEKVHAADARLIAAEREYLASAKAAGEAVDELLKWTNECARRMRNGLHALGGDGPWPSGVARRSDVTDYAAFAMSYGDGEIISHDGHADEAFDEDGDTNFDNDTWDCWKMMKQMKKESDRAWNRYHHEMMNPQEDRYHGMIDEELGLNME